VDVSNAQASNSTIKLQRQKALIQYEKLGSDTALAIPTNEHYLPLFYALALQNKDETVSFFAEKVTLGSISMRGFRIG
jgi:4,5-DOPA dioxygenase extradiol